MSEVRDRLSLLVACLLVGLFIGGAAFVAKAALDIYFAPSPTPRETPWTWDAPDSNARCYFLEDKPIGCYQKGTAP